MIVLGIETSCDETAVAMVEDGRRLLGEAVASQFDIHARFGGVVPELAGRAHLRALWPLLDRLAAMGADPRRAEAVAFTRGPGLIGSLLVGTSSAKALAYCWRLPLVGVNHLQAHLWAPLLENASIDFPLVGMIVSGGHTMLIHAESLEKSRVLGATRDDAAGEAFDKVASLLGLGFPGGPAIERASREGDAKKYRFPRGMSGSKNLDFSFSGIKTAVIYTLRRFEESATSFRVEDVAASFQAAMVDTLAGKLIKAVERTGVKTVVLGGGVVANTAFRRRILSDLPLPEYRVVIPSLRLCTDNAAMVAAWGLRLLQRKGRDDWSVDADPNLPWEG